MELKNRGLHGFVFKVLIHAPNKKGIYLLFDGHEIIFIGEATDELRDTLRFHLLEHYNGARGHCTQEASGFICEVTADPHKRAIALLREFHTEHGKLPRCNAIIHSV